jgi:hypothetical protein
MVGIYSNPQFLLSSDKPNYTGLSESELVALLRKRDQLISDLFDRIYTIEQENDKLHHGVTHHSHQC